MQRLSLLCALASALSLLSFTAADAAGTPASMPAPRAVRPHGDGIRFEKPRPHAPQDGISLGDVIYAPVAEPTPDAQPEIVATPDHVPPQTEVAEAPSRGPRIIYIGPETERQKHGPMPQIIYGDIPSRMAIGPQIIYGDSGH